MLDLLSVDAGVDPNRIAVVGLGLGGRAALLASAFSSSASPADEPRFAAAVALSFLGAAPAYAEQQIVAAHAQLRDVQRLSEALAMVHVEWEYLDSFGNAVPGAGNPLPPDLTVDTSLGFAENKNAGEGGDTLERLTLAAAARSLRFDQIGSPDHRASHPHRAEQLGDR